MRELRSSLIEAYSQITLGVQDSNTHAQFAPFIPKMFDFFYKATYLERSNSNYKAIAGLLGDLAGCMKGQIGQHLTVGWIREMLEGLKQQGDNESKETAMWAWDQIQQAIGVGATPQMHAAM